MNIREAKQEIQHTLQAYLQKDDSGRYVFPAVHQRPILLMGPPGVGKTAIMEQVASECGVALVAYTITHHTRQSAIGLPHIERKTYGGVEMDVTEYTMSEIIASVYETMERTGKKEGILFLDEINCVSETLAPTMLQFLQNKTFGTHRVPDGWILVAAGNPPQYNKSVREFDVVTLDRVRQIDVEADLNIWLDYAREKQVHGAILSYLSIKPDRFYSITRKNGELSFVTARGWEDLSQILRAYEQLQVPITRDLISQYLHSKDTAGEFAAYYSLYRKYDADYGIGEILSGSISGESYQEKTALAAAAGLDERLTVTNLIADRLLSDLAEYGKMDAYTQRLYEILKRFLGGSQPFDEFIAGCKNSYEIKQKNSLLTPSDAAREEQVLHRLDQMQSDLQSQGIHGDQQAEYLKALFSQDTEKRSALISRIQTELENAFRFLSDSFGEGQEILLLVSSLSRSEDALHYLRCHGCDAYLKYAGSLLYRQQERALQDACRVLL